MLEKEVKVAVIMSIYINDNIEHVKMAVNSLFEQTHKLFDLYIQIDGKIPDLVQDFLNEIKGYPNIYIYQEKKNIGLAKSLNKLLSVVLPKNYKYIARMDADDVSFPSRFLKQVEYLEVNSIVDIVGTWAIEIDENGNEFFKKQTPVSHSECYEFFKKRDCMIHPTVMYRNTYFEKAGLYPEDTYFGEDTVMWAQGFANGCIFANIPEYLFYFRLNSSFFNRRRGWKHAKSILLLRKRVNKLVGYGTFTNTYAYIYALVKLLPTSLLSLIYRHARQ